MVNRCLSQYFRDGDAVDVFHREVGTALPRRARAVDSRDVRVVHQGESLAFRLEPGNDLFRIHAPLDELESHFAADGLLLLGLVNDTSSR